MRPNRNNQSFSARSKIAFKKIYFNLKKKIFPPRNTQTRVVIESRVHHRHERRTTLSIRHKHLYLKNKEKQEIPTPVLYKELFNCVFNGDYEKTRNFLEKRRSSAIDLNYKNNEYQSLTVLHLATIYNELQIAQLLLQHGADVDVADKRGTTALHYAARNNSKDMIRLLLSYHANPTLVDKSGFSPFQICVLNKFYDAARIIAQQRGGNDALNREYKEKTTLFHECLANGDTDTLKFLMSLQDSNGHVMVQMGYHNQKGDPAIFEICKCNKLDCLEMLLRHNQFRYIVNTHNDANQNIIHAAVEHNRDDILQHIKKFTSERLVKQLINMYDKRGMTPLHLAIKMNRTKIVKTLVEEMGADVNRKMKADGRKSPLQLCCVPLEGVKKVIPERRVIASILIKHGAKLHPKQDGVVDPARRTRTRLLELSTSPPLRRLPPSPPLIRRLSSLSSQNAKPSVKFL